MANLWLKLALWLQTARTKLLWYSRNLRWVLFGHYDTDFVQVAATQYRYLVAGIDWGIPNHDDAVIVIIGLRPDGRIELLRHDALGNINPIIIVDRLVPELIDSGIAAIGADYSLGVLSNQLLRRRCSIPVVEFQYAATGELLRRQPAANIWLLNKTKSLLLLIDDFNQRRLTVSETLDGSRLLNQTLQMYQAAAESADTLTTPAWPQSRHRGVDALNFALMAARIHIDSATAPTPLRLADVTE